MKICVFCASSDALSAEYYAAAGRLGQLMGERAHTLVFGAGSGGMMRCTADGVKSAGGRIIGIAPRFLCDAVDRYADCNEMLYTETMEQRKALMLSESDAFIVLPGGLGTFDEFFAAATLKQMGQLNKPIVIVNTNGFYDKLISFLADCVEKGFVGRSFFGAFRAVDTPEAAISAVESLHESAEIRTLIGYNY